MPSPLSSRKPFFPRALNAAILLLLATFTTLAAAAPPDPEIDPWKPSGSLYYIAAPLRLNLGFIDQTGTPRVATVLSLQPDQLAGLPGLANAKDSALFRTGYFDTLWTAMKAGVCNDVLQRIKLLENTPPNTAYDFEPCVMNPHSYLLANFQESWEDDNTLQQMTGHRVRFQFYVPLNGITFWETSPHTCHHGDTCPTEPQDPVFTVVFNANITVTCTSSQPNAPTFTLPAVCTPATSIDIEAVLGGDVTNQLLGAIVEWSKQMVGEAASVVATGGASAPEAAAAFAAQAVNVAVQGLGTAIAAATDQHLRDHVSSVIIGFVGSNTLGANAQNINAEFSSLFQNLYYANIGGLKPFVIGISPQLDLDFGLVYPIPAKPQIENTTAADNKTSLFSPTIAVSQPEVVAGQMLPVTASYFRGAYVTALNIAWNRTVLGAVKSTLAWGPPPTSIDIPALAFDATDLKPSTTYHFAVHECDGLTCAPWSEELTTATEAAGSNEVLFWLDNNTQKLGNNVVGSTGATFQTNVQIPAATAPGQHQLHAAAAGSPIANATIFVCQPGGCGPTVALVNTSNNTLYPPDSVVEVGNPVLLRGSRFTPGGSVSIFVDTLNGPRAGTAPVGPLGNFQASFTMPMVPAGQHQFLAVEGNFAPHPILKALGKQAQPAPPPAPANQPYTSAVVKVYVQAMAQ